LARRGDGQTFGWCWFHAWGAPPVVDRRRVGVVSVCCSRTRAR
jgi:hypothetical protein